MRPVLFEIGPVAIYSYGAMLAAGFLIAATLATRHAKAEGVAPGKILDLALFILITGIIGSRILYVALNWANYSKNFFRIFLLNEGGLSIYGGFAFSIPVSIWFIKKNGLSLWKTLDLISPYVALAQSIGRIGCFLNGCCYGKPTDLFWGVHFPALPLKVHPTQLYSSFGDLIIFIMLKYYYKKHRFEGEIFFLYLMLYSIFRFFIEMLRGDNPIFIFGITFYQCASIALFLGSAIFYIKRRRPCSATLLQ